MDVKQTLWKGADWIDLGQGRWVVGCCERGNETSCFIAYEDFWTKEVKNTIRPSATSVAARPNDTAGATSESSATTAVRTQNVASLRSLGNSQGTEGPVHQFGS